MLVLFRLAAATSNLLHVGCRTRNPLSHCQLPCTGIQQAALTLGVSQGLGFLSPWNEVELGRRNVRGNQSLLSRLVSLQPVACMHTHACVPLLDHAHSTPDLEGPGPRQQRPADMANPSACAASFPSEQF